MPTNENERVFLIEIALVLVQRLERLSADSIWAHRASGVRGSLLRKLDDFNSLYENGTNQKITDETLGDLGALVDSGFELLENAAREY